MWDNEIEPKLPKARPVIGWPGGKTRLLKHILPLIPEHTTYVEPFGGGMAVLIAKPRSEVEIVNDINKDLVTFYRCARFHLEPLLDELDLVLNSRQEFEDYCQQPGLTELQRAARWFVKNKLSFGGKGHHFGTSKKRGMASRTNRIMAIRSLNRRLDKTTIENRPWDKLLELYDHEDAFHFMDPPYLDSGGSAYDGWSEHELNRFALHVQELEGKWMVTFQDCEQIRNAFTGYTIHGITRANGIGNTTGEKNRTYAEVIITSEPTSTGRTKKGKTA